VHAVEVAVDVELRQDCRVVDGAAGGLGVDRGEAQCSQVERIGVRIPANASITRTGFSSSTKSSSRSGNSVACPRAWAVTNRFITAP
jgi:hypothetical protein